MKIEIAKSTIEPMMEWLRVSKEQGVRDEKKLKEILSMPDYQVEFARYGDPNLPTCGISFEEAVDFFLHFDEKEFDNPRLKLKKEYYIPFYNNMDKQTDQVEMLTQITPKDMELVKTLLENGLPLSLLNELNRITVLLTVSIGNSMGWPYGEYVHFDVSNMSFIEDKSTFFHILAHEIHHIMFSNLLPDDMKPQQYFFINFAFEGLAMHFCNNAATKNKPGKYGGEMWGVDKANWAFFEEQHDELIQKVLSDGEKARGMTIEQVGELVKEYEQFSFTSLKTGVTRQVTQYPTYYIGCYLWGTIEQKLGKDRLFEILKSENGFEEVLDLFSSKN